ncbi:MAG: glycosyltransferase, partial [Bryobacteraceae bacterium]
GASFAPFASQVRDLRLEDRVLVRENVSAIEDYLQVADLGFFTSENESFCLSILEAMCFGVPTVARPVGGIPEVVQHQLSGLLVDSNRPEVLARAVQSLMEAPEEHARMGGAARQRAREHFSAEVILPRYEALYRRVCGMPAELPILPIGS